jgi:hypothetical protein
LQSDHHINDAAKRTDDTGKNGDLEAASLASGQEYLIFNDIA